MPETVCPWWLGYLLANPVRRLFQDPREILGPHVADGMTALEPGPGMGFFTLELARLVGETGRVVAVDVQPKMLDGLKRRAGRAGLGRRIDCRVAAGERLGVADLAGAVDFVLAFAVIHELPDVPGFFAETHAALKPGGTLLICEPRNHVSPEAFAATLTVARESGFVDAGQPQVRWSRTALLRRP
jgi:ubiquinone/menaquinone biosynthesis C-methylase UbiE